MDRSKWGETFFMGRHSQHTHVGVGRTSGAITRNFTSNQWWVGSDVVEFDRLGHWLQGNSRTRLLCSVYIDKRKIKKEIGKGIGIFISDSLWVIYLYIGKRPNKVNENDSFNSPDSFILSVL